MLGSQDESQVSEVACGLLLASCILHDAACLLARVAKMTHTDALRQIACCPLIDLGATPDNRRTPHDQMAKTQCRYHYKDIRIFTQRLGRRKRGRRGPKVNTISRHIIDV